MATHLSEAEASKDISALMAQVREGGEVLIESPDGFVASLQPADPSPRGKDPEYDAWLCRKVQQALDDPRPPVPHDEVLRRLEEHRLLSKAKYAGPNH